MYYTSRYLTYLFLLTLYAADNIRMKYSIITTNFCIKTPTVFLIYGSQAR